MLQALGCRSIVTIKWIRSTLVSGPESPCVRPACKCRWVVMNVQAAHLTGCMWLCRGPAPAGKRRLLPAPKPLPMGAVSALSQDVLFGQGFKVPRLGRQ